MAVGSTPDAIFRMVLRQGLEVTALGLLLGGVSALVFTRLIRSLLFSVDPTDFMVLLGTALLLAMVAVVACALPAWRATRIDPSVALQAG